MWGRDGDDLGPTAWKQRLEQGVVFQELVTLKVQLGSDSVPREENYFCSIETVKHSKNKRGHTVCNTGQINTGISVLGCNMGQVIFMLGMFIIYKINRKSVLLHLNLHLRLTSRQRLLKFLHHQPGCETSAELRGRPEWLRIYLRQRYIKLIKMLLLQQLTKSSNFTRESGESPSLSFSFMLLWLTVCWYSRSLSAGV